MSLLVLIWVVALALAGGAIVGMSVLIGLRLRHERRTARRLADRRQVEQALIGVMQGRCDPHATLGPYRRRARLIAETLLDFLGIVRGEDRQLVVAALASVGADQTLRARLGRGSLAGRLASVEALGAFPSPETQFALVRASTRGPEEVRLAALRSLIQAGGEVTPQQLVAQLDRGRLTASGQFADLLRLAAEQDPAAAQAVAEQGVSARAEPLILEALGAAGAYGALPLLIAKSREGAPESRRAAIEALARLMHPAAEPALAQALDDPVAEIRSAAALAIGLARFVGQADALAARLDDEVWRVRHQAAAALARLGAPGLERLTAISWTSGARARAAALALAEAA